LLKDWEAHKHTFRRYSVLALILVTLVGGSVNLWITDRHTVATDNQRAIERARAEEQIKALQKSVDAGETGRHIDTQQFLGQLAKLSSQVSELGADQKTRQLKQEIINLQETLKTSDKVTAEVTRLHSAELSFGFFEPDRNKTPPRATIAQLVDGYVSLEVTAFNHSGAAASNGFIYFRICSGCKFAAEPEPSNRVEGAMEDERETPFAMIGTNTRLQPIRMKIIPPTPAPFAISFRYACQTCVENTWQVLTVDIAK
jgi:hypothetical protein